jgi:hypothetical protein
VFRRFRKLIRRGHDYLDLIAWNVYRGNSDANVVATLIRWADNYEPDVFALSECNTHADALREFCRKRPYRLLMERPERWDGRGLAPAAGDCATLVRESDEVVLLRRWVARMTELWTVFSHRQRREPREYEVAALRVRGRRWRVRNEHPPTNGLDGGNAEAFRESLRKARRWLLRGLAPSVVVGDMNEKAAALAEWFGKRFRVFGRGIDVAVTRWVTHCEWDELPKGGGDHHGRRYRFLA